MFLGGGANTLGGVACLLAVGDAEDGVTIVTVLCTGATGTILGEMGVVLCNEGTIIGDTGMGVARGETTDWPSAIKGLGCWIID